MALPCADIMPDKLSILESGLYPNVSTLQRWPLYCHQGL